ncbi:unnamed protein product [Moneuplotes crassus]|uniref:Uncharacterized protein n=1 Tax=Euplotes crassus TaxID=5936 RepID=A0AAD1XX03_EUPCR|nr:unnamed protein product [Moneuplotes crassus]
MEMFSPCFITETPQVQRATLEPSVRVDIQRRKMLRTIKRFYYEFFKLHNLRLFNRRLKRVESSVILSSLSKFCEVYVSQAHAEDMAQFMFRFLKLNCADNFVSDSEASMAGQKVYDCTYNYSINKFDSLFESEHFRILILSYSELQQLRTPNLQEMKSQRKWVNQVYAGDGEFSRIISRYLHMNPESKTAEHLMETRYRCKTY